MSPKFPLPYLPPRLLWRCTPTKVRERESASERHIIEKLRRTCSLSSLLSPLFLLSSFQCSFFLPSFLPSFLHFCSRLLQPPFLSSSLLPISPPFPSDRARCLPRVVAPPPLLRRTLLRLPLRVLEKKAVLAVRSRAKEAEREHARYVCRVFGSASASVRGGRAGWRAPVDGKKHGRLLDRRRPLFLSQPRTSSRRARSRCDRGVEGRRPSHGSPRSSRRRYSPHLLVPRREDCVGRSQRSQQGLAFLQ